MTQRLAYRSSVFTSWIVVALLSIHAIAEPANLPPDVRLIIDVSGSMKQNDPNNLRQPAVELLVQLLPENSKAGVWTFGQWVNMLVPHKPVTDEWKTNAQSMSDKINSAGLYTNIGAALEKASYDRNSRSDEYSTSIILLTDGMVDIDKSPSENQKEWRRIVDDVIPKLKEAGYVVHTIALSDNADTNLLNKLSISTDGIAEVAYSAEDLMKVFLKAFDVAAPAEQVPLLDNRFSIDSSVEEFTALIFREQLGEQTVLVGPDDAEYSFINSSPDVKWHRASNYDLITVKRPLEGEWGVKAAMAPESRVTVVSNLNLKVKSLPNNIFKGQTVDVSLMLKEDGNTIKRSEFLSLMDITLSMEAGRDEFELKEYWSELISDRDPPENGIYQTQLPPFEKDGIYQLNVFVDGKSFVRQFTHQFNSREPFGADIKQVFIDGELVYVLTANAYTQDIDVTKTQLAATVIAPDGRRKIIPLESTEVDTWNANVYPDQEGNYSASIRVRGQNMLGEKFNLMLENIEFSYSEEGGFIETPEPFFDEESGAELAEEEKPDEEVVKEESTQKETEDTKGEDEEEQTQEQAEEQDNSAPSKMSAGITYGLLGLGNILLFGLGFLAYKMITKGNEDDLGDFSEEGIEEKIAEVEALEPEEVEEVEDEEPPMEDLDPTIDSGVEEDLEPEMGVEDPEPDLTPEPMDLGIDDSALEDVPIEDDEPEMLDPMSDGEDDFDDLDAMVADAEDSEEEDEEDDMVAAMLKAQGLDLAEEELDDAISGLIDDLEDAEKGADDIDDL